MLDGAARLGPLVSRAARLGQRALAITDHGQLHGAYQFYRECKSQGIKPIIGCEFYVAPESTSSNERRKIEGYSGGGSYSHLTVLATNTEGLRNLFRLNSESYNRGFYYKPRSDLDSLESNKKGLVLASGCLSSELSVYIQRYDEAAIDQYVSRMRDTFGDSFFIEVMEHGFEREQAVTKRLLEVASRHGVPTLGTNDSHYVGPSDSVLHDAMLCLQTRSSFDDPKRLRFDGSGYYLKARRDLQLPKEALDNTLLVAERVEDYDWDTSSKFPSSGYSDPTGELYQRCWDALPNVSYGNELVYEERLERELAVITKLGFEDYFLVIADVLEGARSQREPIRFGPGRGSANGSLVAYLLNITRMDPIQHSLLFERFLNEDRVNLPDIDIDVDDSRRDELLELVRSKYGEEACAQICTISTIGAKAAIRDATRVLGHPFNLGSKLSGALPKAEFGRQPSLSDLDRGEALKGIDKTSGTKILDLANDLEGLARQPGVHAAGFVISPIPLTDVIPTWKQAGKGGAITQWDQHAVEALGFIKFDFLGLRNIGVIDDCLSRLPGTPLELPVHPDEATDTQTYRMLGNGHSVGVFQLDSSGMQRLLRKVCPVSIHDIAAVCALYRPGPMGANAHYEYADRKNHRKRIQYPHPELETRLAPILASTYGLFVFQEQIIQALVEVCGYTLGEADVVRKIMGKKDRDTLREEQVRFEARTSAAGLSQEASLALWGTMVPFADYAFNKSHAYGYAYVSYWTAYLKANYPKEYFCSLLSRETDKEKATEYINEFRRMGYVVLSPDVNESDSGWTVHEKGIRYGLATIKGIGPKVIASIKSRAPYTNWEDFLKRLPDGARRANVLSALIKSGSLDTLGNREVLSDVYLEHAAQAESDLAEIKRGDRRLFPYSYALEHRSPDYTLRQRDEIEVLGVRLSEPPTVITLPANLSSTDWEYVRRSLADNPGSSPLTITVGTWTMDGGSVNISEVMRALAPLRGK